MDISSSLTGTKEFRIVKRGYDPDEVNAFLDQIALGVGELKRKLTEKEDEVTAVKARAAAAPPPPPPVPAAAPAPAPDAAAQADEIHRALILAQRAADEEVRKATEQGEEMVSSARAQAEELRRDVEAEVARRRDAGRTELLAEIEELERVRDSLANDVTVLDRHVDEQREVVQAAIGELQSLLDHPEAFRVAVATEVALATPPIDRAPAVPVEQAPAGPAAAPEPTPVATTGQEELPGVVDLSAALAAVDAPDEPDEPAPAVEGTTDTRPPRSPFEPVAPPPPSPQAAAATPRPEGDSTVAFAPAPPPPPSADPFAGPRGGDDDDRDVGPPTEAIAAVGADGDPDEDAFLAELRKAMLDDEPLGPRETGALPSAFDDDGADGGRRRGFGRRR